MPKQTTRARIAVVSFLVIALAAALAIYFVADDKTSVSNINSFDECVEAGYPVQLSYPGVCSVPGGKSFTDD